MQFGELICHALRRAARRVAAAAWRCARLDRAAPAQVNVASVASRVSTTASSRGTFAGVPAQKFVERELRGAIRLEHRRVRLARDASAVERYVGDRHRNADAAHRLEKARIRDAIRVRIRQRALPLGTRGRHGERHQNSVVVERRETARRRAARRRARRDDRRGARDGRPCG